MSDEATPSYIIETDSLPDAFPTHRHAASFWEQLGRCIGSFGFLEETLGKAIFSFTATTEVDESNLEAAYKAWLKNLGKALSDELGRLITSYEKAVQSHQEPQADGFEGLIADLRQLQTIRNVICHASWKLPDDAGFSHPFFTNRDGEVWNVPMDEAYLVSLQKSTLRLTVAVINTVTSLGWQFPGSAGPGRPIWPAK